MDPTMTAVSRSVQRAVMQAPTTTITDAAEAARRAGRALATGVDITFHVTRPRAIQVAA